MRRYRLTALAAVLFCTLATTMQPAAAITFGQPDGTRHPNVGALLADVSSGNPGPDIICSGTLIDERVFLTAAHCTASLASQGIDTVWVTFDPTYDEDSTSTAGLLRGTYVNHPDFGSGGQSDTHDIAVVLLKKNAGVQPADLPTAGLLSRLKAEHELRDRRFTAVGYGLVRDDKTGGPHGFSDGDGIRRFALQSALSLQKSWLTLSMQPSTGNGGTCYGDSGGPHFLGGARSNLIVSITVSGDAMCRALDTTYRLDTPAVRDFLDDFVALP